MIGFILTRHVNSPETNNYWIESYSQIRKFYPMHIIMIIDDNSNYTYIKQPETLHLTNCFIIQSQFPQRGELLAYYYFHKYNLFDKAVILHDSVFIQNYIDFDAVTDIKFLWHFYHDWDDNQTEKQLLNTLPDNIKLQPLEAYEEKSNWYAAFGVQSVITRDFLNLLINRYNIFTLLNHVDNRQKRMAVERIFGLLCSQIKPELVDEPSLFGTIHSYCKWGTTYTEYKNTQSLNLVIRKVWSAR